MPTLEVDLAQHEVVLISEGRRVSIKAFTAMDGQPGLLLNIPQGQCLCFMPRGETTVACFVLGESGSTPYFVRLEYRRKGQQKDSGYYPLSLEEFAVLDQHRDRLIDGQFGHETGPILRAARLRTPVAQLPGNYSYIQVNLRSRVI